MKREYVVTVSHLWPHIDWDFEKHKTGKVLNRLARDVQVIKIFDSYSLEPCNKPQLEFDNNNNLPLSLGWHWCVKDLRCEIEPELETQTVKAREKLKAWLRVRESMTVSEHFLSRRFSHRFYKLCLSSEGETQRIKWRHTDMKMLQKSFISVPNSHWVIKVQLNCFEL